MRVRRIAFDAARHLLRRQARAIHHRIDVKLPGLAPAETHPPAIQHRRQRFDRCLERDGAAMRFDIALQRQHVSVPVDDAGRGRDQRRDAGQFRLEIARGIAADQFKPLDAVDRALRVDRFDPRALGVVGRDDELAAAAMRDAVGLAEVVEQRLPRAQSAARRDPVG